MTIEELRIWVLSKIEEHKSARAAAEAQAHAQSGAIQAYENLLKKINDGHPNGGM